VRPAVEIGPGNVSAIQLPDRHEIYAVYQQGKPPRNGKRVEDGILSSRNFHHKQ